MAKWPFFVACNVRAANEARERTLKKVKRQNILGGHKQFIPQIIAPHKFAAN